jgi:hypothetical protein
MQVVPMAPVLSLVLLLLSTSCFANDHAGDELNYMVVPTGSLKHIAEGDVCSGHKGVYYIQLNIYIAAIHVN